MIDDEELPRFGIVVDSDPIEFEFPKSLLDTTDWTFYRELEDA